MNRRLEAIAIAAARECERQHVDEDALIRLLTAHNAAMTQAARRALPDVRDVVALGEIIEPPLVPGSGAIRVTPVTFASGGTAVDASRIDETLRRMFDLLDAETDADEFTKAFLDVHPFRDGNGRAAWLLHNWLTGRLGDPAPLPDFYGTDVLVAS